MKVWLKTQETSSYIDMFAKTVIIFGIVLCSEASSMNLNYFFR